MNEGLLIIHLQPSDWERLRAIRLASLLESPDWLSGKGFEFESQATEEFWQERISTDMWFIATNKDRDIAVMNAGEPNPNFPTSRWLQACWIEVDQRGRGVLNAMIEFLDGFGASLGWETLGLGVWLGNNRAQSAYERAGFTALSEPLPSRKNPGKFYIAMSREIKHTHSG
jgi:RimJ/RimL family protein N-acetyltransferase